MIKMNIVISAMMLKRASATKQKPLSCYLLTKISRAIPVSMANSENPTLKM